MISTEVYKVEARVATIAAVELIFYGWIFFYYAHKGRKLFHRAYWTKALKLNLPLVPHYLSGTVLNQADRIMIGHLATMGAVGIYGLACSLSSIMNVVKDALMKTLEPWIYQKISKGKYNEIANISYLGLITMGLLNLLLIAFAPEAIALFAPPEYAGAMLVVPPLASSVFLTFMYNLFAEFEFYYEKTILVMLASITGAAVNIVLNLVFIPWFGYTVAGYTTLISYAVYISMHYFFMRMVQQECMSGIRVFDLRILITICLAYTIVAIALVVAYPYLLIRFCIIAAFALGLFIKRASFYDAWNELRSGKIKT